MSEQRCVELQKPVLGRARDKRPLARQGEICNASKRSWTPKTPQIAPPGYFTPCIPPSLGDIICDPGGTLQGIGVLSPKEFWQWYHADDGPRDGWGKHMGLKWGELWWEYLLTDQLVLAGAVPLVLQKKAQMTGVSQDRNVRIAETKAIENLRKRLANPDAASLGGLVMGVCGRIQISIQQGDNDVASMHLQAVVRMLKMYEPSPTEWLCSAWSDLRVMSSTNLPPMLPRHVPKAWLDPVLLPFESLQMCERKAMQNVRAVRNIVHGHFPLVHAIFKRLHEIDVAAEGGTTPKIPIGEIYYTTYDSCVFHTESRIVDSPVGLAARTELLAICLKICAWETASACIPRGGEIERNLLERALQIVDAFPCKIWADQQQNTKTSSLAMVWILYNLTVTAYMFRRNDMEKWIGHLKPVLESRSLNTPNAIRRALKGWPCAHWWLSRTLERVCDMIVTPSKGRWQLLRPQQDDMPAFETALRLKLLVIED